MILRVVSFFYTKTWITRNLNQNRKYFNPLLSGPGWFQWWKKNWRSKISLDCPFNREGWLGEMFQLMVKLQLATSTHFWNMYGVSITTVINMGKFCRISRKFPGFFSFIQFVLRLLIKIEQKCSEKAKVFFWGWDQILRIMGLHGSHLPIISNQKNPYRWVF